MALKVVKIDKEPRVLWVTVRGDNIDEVNSLAARQLAYEERLNHGFENAGIEASGGSYPIDKTKLAEDGDAKDATPLTHKDMKEISTRPKDIIYEHLYKITRGI